MAKRPAPAPQKRPAAPTPAKPRAAAAAAPPPADHQNPSALSRWWMWGVAVLLITAICYWPSLNNSLVNWDDDPNITENENIMQTGLIPWSETVSNIFDVQKGAVIGNYNPLPIYTFALEKKWSDGQINERLIHSTNLFFHLLTVALVMLLLARMGMGRWGIVAGGLLFGIHPMRVESVAWATERKDVLFAAFFFAALLCYDQWVKSRNQGLRIGLYVAMLGLATLSLFSKVQAVTLPLSMLVLDYWYRRPLKLGLIVEKIPFFLLSLFFGITNLFTLGSNFGVKVYKAMGWVSANYVPQLVSINDDSAVTNFSALDRMCIGMYSFCVYLYKAVIPYPMSPLYPYPKPLPFQVYLAPLAFAAAWVGIWWLWKRDRRMWVFGMLFFWLNVMFLLQWFGAGQGFLADRFTYVPYFGLFAIAAYYFERGLQREDLSMILKIAAGIAALVYGVWTVKQVKIWENGETLWSHVMQYENKTNSLPFWNRGQYRRKLGKYDIALQDYSQAIAIEGNKPELYNSRGKTYFDMGTGGKYPKESRDLIQKAITDYDKGLSLPNIPTKAKAETLINRGAAYGALGDFEKTVSDINEGLALDSLNKNGYFNRSIAYYTLRQYDKALQDYDHYLRFDPINANIWY
ncbi:MAG TPA: tetratricopeptide repeat protein, partial [Saprospiraceae bacterium]|nr:tetratricopeptide repeat protein [Saprospiraceae bacterium]